MNADEKYLELGERMLLALQNLDLTVESLVAEMKKTRESAKEPEGLI
jgi:hypothetical protein